MPTNDGAHATGRANTEGDHYGQKEAPSPQPVRYGPETPEVPAPTPTPAPEPETQPDTPVV